MEFKETKEENPVNDLFNDQIDDIDKLIDDSNTPWYEKLWDNIVYYCWDKPRSLYYDITWYFKNRRLFRKIMWEWRPWDYIFQMELFAFGLEQLKKSMETGNEERESANKKIAACAELIKQLKRDVEDEMPFNPKTDDIKEWSININKEKRKQYDEIHRLMIGQNPFDYNGSQASSPDGYKEWVEWFDGTGIEGWWD